MVLIIMLSIVAGMVVWNGTFLKTKYDSAQDNYDHEQASMTETQFQLIRAGIQAASSHNMQPWKIKIIDDQSFVLYADLTKHLPIIDPDYQQLLMGQGTFIALIRATAEQLGIALEVNYHPLNMEEELPIIATFTSDAHEDSTIDSVTAASAGSESEEPSFAVHEATQFIHDLAPKYVVKWIAEENRSEFQDYLYTATEIEAENQQAMEEMLDVFRFTKWEKNKYRYGLSLNTIGPPLNTFIPPIVGLTAQWKSFGKATINSFEERLANEELYLVLALENPTQSDYIEVGEVITGLTQRVAGFTLRPAVQILQPLAGMEEVYREMHEVIGIEGEIIQIIGFTKKDNAFHDSIRHQVMDLILE
ncbi:hypothetical protein SAMN04488134_10685 [Amphibacillus marinus]|uniref:Nitroreductase family protein n=1 Tax=Amphibacillus marinus TaxID=872970 RepID=A0A1H8NS38_9BACI|nr:hypothetical protein [Amphibacillus marinus]SEO32412.1 hypothetical protein SAMN04488134_10685 [Amphibacillus marinus]